VAIFLFDQSRKFSREFDGEFSSSLRLSALPFEKKNINFINSQQQQQQRVKVHTSILPPRAISNTHEKLTKKID